MDNWISVDEKLPDEGEVVRVLFEDKKEDSSKFYGGEFYIFPEWDVITNITHWKSSFKKPVHTQQETDNWDRPMDN